MTPEDRNAGTGGQSRITSSSSLPVQKSQVPAQPPTQPAAQSTTGKDGDEKPKTYVRQYVMRDEGRQRWYESQPRQRKRRAADGAGGGEKAGAERRRTTGAETPDDSSGSGNGSGDVVTAERRRKAKILLITMFLVLTAVLSYPLIRLCMAQFVIRDVIVTGEVPYTADELLAASGLSLGDKLYGNDTSVIAEETLGKLTYLRSCSVSVKWPDAIVFTVSAGNAVIYTEVAGEYYALSATLRVLEREQDPMSFIAAGLIHTDLPRASRTVVGSHLVLSDGVDYGYITDFIDALSSSELNGSVSRIFLEEKFNIVASVSGRCRVNFGTPSDMPLKLLTAARIIADPEFSEDEKLIIDVSDPSVSGVIRASTLDPNTRSD